MLALLALGGCGPSSDERASREPPPPPRLAPALPPEPAPAAPVTTIARGIALEDSSSVFDEPDPESRVFGLVRKGARFDLVEQRTVGDQLWWRIRDAGWISDRYVRASAEGEPTTRFIPFQPRMNNPMPYNIARVIARDGVPVYRRPPPRGDDPERYVERQLREGYFFTVDRWVNIYDRQLHRGIRYWFVPREGTTMVTPPDFEGVALSEQVQLPFLWVTDPTARICTDPEGSGDGPRGCTPVDRHTRIPYRGERRVQGGVWYETEGGFIASLQVSKVTRITTYPEGLHEGEHWVHVDLLNQFAALYEGVTPTFVTLISSGDDQHPTPTGSFRLESKHISATMDDEENLAGAYFIQDVPWVMYFRGSYALHGAFWHDRFGLRTSHGCVNLAPKDARRFFEFTTAPALPTGLHAVFAPDARPGTLVHVTR
jgi:hypothetical protein